MPRMSFETCISSTQVPVIRLQHAYVMQNNMLERYYESRGICISCLNQFQIGLDLYQSYIGSILSKPSRKQFETSHFLQLQGLGFRQIMGIICLTFWQWQKLNRLSLATLVCLSTKMKLVIMNFRCHWKARCDGTARMLRWRFESYPLTELCFPQPVWETREKKNIICISVCLGIRRDENNGMETCDQSASSQKRAFGLEIKHSHMTCSLLP